MFSFFSGASGGKPADEAAEEAANTTNQNNTASSSTTSESLIPPTLMSWMSSAVSTAASAAAKLKSTVEELPVLKEFNSEQNNFVHHVHKRTGEGVPPWVGYEQEEQMKAQILSLSSDRRNFLSAPPSTAQFPFTLESYFPCALATLEHDSQLSAMRFDLVPKEVTEEQFWRNYFYRVGLIKQSCQLAATIHSTHSAAASSVDPKSSRASMDESLPNEASRTPVNRASPGTPRKAPAASISDSLLEPASVDSEFVSDNLNSSVSSDQALSKELSDLGLGKPNASPVPTSTITSTPTTAAVPPATSKFSYAAAVQHTAVDEDDFEVIEDDTLITDDNFEAELNAMISETM